MFSDVLRKSSPYNDFFNVANLSFNITPSGMLIYGTMFAYHEQLTSLFLGYGYDLGAKGQGQIFVKGMFLLVTQTLSFFDLKTYLQLKMQISL